MIALSIALLALVQTPASRTDTIPPSAALESPYTIRSGALQLSGTLTLPSGTKGRVPVAVIIAGSGPTDRNGNSSLGIRPNSYAQLAWRLAERGVATLRYNKRVLPGTTGTVDIAHLTLDDFAVDARAAADSLARDARFSNVMLLGHSEGAALALIAARNDPSVTGVILASGLGRPFTVVVREQLARQFDSATLISYDTAMTQYLAGQQPKNVPPPLAPLFVPINQNFMKSFASFDPVAAIRQVRQPVLIVQGARDIQVTVGDAERLHGAKPDAQLVIIPLANHVMKQARDTTLTGQLPLYQDPTIPIMPEVAGAISDWILKLAR
ncbi:MAG TPA: alpha/beta fold hydrolase [Gemmatimonadales bacterium]|nr:alpha/beta fold hydrolase [Gemmatimonadales bacterium]